MVYFFCLFSFSVRVKIKSRLLRISPFGSTDREKNKESEKNKVSIIIHCYHRFTCIFLSIFLWEKHSFFLNLRNIFYRKRDKQSLIAYSLFLASIYITAHVVHHRGQEKNFNGRRVMFCVLCLKREDWCIASYYYYYFLVFLYDSNVTLMHNTVVAVWYFLCERIIKWHGHMHTFLCFFYVNKQPNNKKGNWETNKRNKVA